ncbi:MAG: hypothetical protein ABJA89_12645 [Lapillicoccus sp.]
MQAGLSAYALTLVTTTFSSHFTKTVAEAPVFRTTGDLVVTVGGDTWKLTV